MTTPRVDRLLARLMDDYEHGDLPGVDALAEQVAMAHPALRAWSTYVQAGIRALEGEPAAGLRMIAAADERGDWWSPELVQDPALATVWPLDRTGIRARLDERWRAAQARAEVGWELLPASAPPAAVVISLHGNCPAPADQFRSLWQNSRRAPRTSSARRSS